MITSFNLKYIMQRFVRELLKILPSVAILKMWFNSKNTINFYNNEMELN